MPGAEAAGGGPARRRWRAGDYFDLALLSSTHGLSDGFTHLLVPVIALIVADLNLSNVEAGALLSVFSLATFVFLTPLSILADHAGRKKTFLIAGLGISGLAFLSMGGTLGFYPLVALAFLAGVGNSVYHPCGTSLAAERFPEDRAFAISYHGLGGNVGTSLMPIFQASVASLAGWRMAVMACVIPALALLPLVGIRYPREGGKAADERQEKEGPGHLALLGKVLRNRNIVLLGMTYTLRAMGTTGVIALFPLVAVQNAGMNTASIGLAISVYFGTGVVTKPIMGMLYDRFGARTALFLPMLLTGAVSLAIGFTSWPLGLIVLAGVVGALSHVSPIVLTATADLCAPEALASSVGFIYTVHGLRFISPLLGGWLAEYYGFEASYVFFALAIWAGMLVSLRIRAEKPARG